MKQLFILIFLISYTPMISQQVTPTAAFLEKWNNSKEYLLKIAKSMPEDTYSYRPTAEQMDFKSQLVHICGNMLWLSTNYFTDEKFDRKKFAENTPNSKDEVIQLLEESFDSAYNKVKNTPEESLATEVNFFAGRKSKLQILNLLQDHVTHHRGQLIVYLNLNKIKPPEYVGW